MAKLTDVNFMLHHGVSIDDSSSSNDSFGADMCSVPDKTPIGNGSKTADHSSPGNNSMISRVARQTSPSGVIPYAQNQPAALLWNRRKNGKAHYPFTGARIFINEKKFYRRVLMENNICNTSCMSSTPDNDNAVIYSRL